MASSQQPEPAGHARRRSCTDVLCLLVWAAFLAGWVAVAAFAYARGDPALLLHAVDSRGHPCGAPGTDVADKPYLDYFDITQCISITGVMTCPTKQVCVAHCPKETYNFQSLSDDQCNNTVKSHFVCEEGTDPTTVKCSDIKSDSGRCAPYVLKSVAVLGRCIPNIGPGDLDKYGRKVKDQDGNGFLDISDLTVGADHAGKLASLAGLGMDAFSDLQHSWWVIVVACVAAMLLSLLWIFLLRFVAAVLIWGAFLGALGVVVYGCVYTYLRYDDLKGVPGSDAGINPLNAFTGGFGSLLDRQETWLIFFVALCAVGVLLLLVLLVLRKRIQVATAMLSQASRAVTSSTSTLFFPLLPWLLQLAVIALFVSTALFIASLGEQSFAVTKLPSSGCPTYQLNGPCDPHSFPDICIKSGGECAANGLTRHRAVTYLHIYNTFGLFWGLFFFSALGEMVLAGAFAAWYWTFDKRRDLPATPLLDSTGRTVRYHLGTLAFGSLLIALIRMARVALDYIARKSRAHLDNVLARAVICCCKCCLWCLEKFMRFINRNAYIMCAQDGTNFCTSAKNAFKLLMRNILRVVVVDSTCDIMLLLGKLVVTALVTIGSFYFIDGRIKIEGLEDDVPDTQHSWVPVATIAIASFFVASVFFSVYTMAVDTIFLCFLEDLENNNGSAEKPYYMSKSLRKILSKKNKRAKED